MEIFIRRHRKAHLLTRGRKWRVRSSSNAQLRSVARSPSDGHDAPRSSSHHGDASNFLERQISIRRATQVEPSRSSNGDQTTAIKTEPRSWLTIVVRSWPDRPTIGANSAPNREPRHGDRGHQTAPTTASNGPNFQAKIPFKKTMYPSLFLQIFIDS